MCKRNMPLSSNLVNLQAPAHAEAPRSALWILSRLRFGRGFWRNRPLAPECAKLKQLPLEAGTVRPRRGGGQADIDPGTALQKRCARPQEGGLTALSGGSIYRFPHSLFRPAWRGEKAVFAVVIGERQSLCARSKGRGRGFCRRSSWIEAL